MNVRSVDGDGNSIWVPQDLTRHGTSRISESEVSLGGAKDRITIRPLEPSIRITLLMVLALI